MPAAARCPRAFAFQSQRRRSRERALAHLGRSGDRGAAGRVSTHQAVVDIMLDPFVDGPPWARRHGYAGAAICAGARAVSGGGRARLCAGAQGAVQAADVRAALERVGWTAARTAPPAIRWWSAAMIS